MFALVDAVVPHPTFIAAKHLSFSDTQSRAGLVKIALYEAELSSEDKSLISEIADLTPFDALEKTGGEFILN